MIDNSPSDYQEEDCFFFTNAISNFINPYFYKKRVYIYK